MYSSEISGFYKLSIMVRLNLIQEKLGLSEQELEIIRNFGYFQPEEMDILIENVIASYQLPFLLHVILKSMEKIILFLW